MRKITVILFVLLLMVAPVFAKGGSGGQLPSGPASSLDQPASEPSSGSSGTSTGSSSSSSGSSEPSSPTSSQPALSPSGTSSPEVIKTEAKKEEVKKEAEKPPETKVEVKKEDVKASEKKAEVKKEEAKAPEKKAEVKKEVPKKEQVKAPEKKVPPAVLQGKNHCGELTTVEERVKCRFEVDESVLKEEIKTAYFPEGCRRGTDTWKEACKTRYKEIGPCWYLESTVGDTYPGKKVYSCLKQKLKLADELKPAASYCKGKDESCKEDYKKAIYNLIIARFYDAEQRAEDFNTQGRLGDEDTQAFIVFITQKKLAFYDAKEKAERVQIIQDVASEWQKLLKKLK